MNTTEREYEIGDPIVYSFRAKRVEYLRRGLSVVPNEMHREVWENQDWKEGIESEILEKNGLSRVRENKTNF